MMCREILKKHVKNNNEMSKIEVHVMFLIYL